MYMLSIFTLHNRYVTYFKQILQEFEVDSGNTSVDEIKIG